jgi:hypothetical protein
LPYTSSLGIAGQFARGTETNSAISAPIFATPRHGGVIAQNGVTARH